MMVNDKPSGTGSFLVAIAAFLWATDALFRYPAIHRVDPGLIVVAEHFLAVLVLLPWMWLKHRQDYFRLTLPEWLAAAFSGAAGSALATLLFTASFRYTNPSVAVLLQKLQPLMVVVIAYFVLGERPQRKFYMLGPVALVAGIILSFPDLNFHLFDQNVSLHSMGVRYALAAALIWAASTVSGKFLLNRIPPTVATFWRFFFGLLAMMAILLSQPPLPALAELVQSTEMIFCVLYLSLLPGLLAMLFYYHGLARSSASVATFVELLYPIGAVVLNTLFLKTPLSLTQTVAGSVLLVSVTLLSLESGGGGEGVKRG